MTRLLHYTCRHGRTGIGERGWVIPVALRNTGLDLTGLPEMLTCYGWFTDLTTPNRDALGLTRTTIRCDRTRYRYRVTCLDDEHGLLPWTEARRDWPRHLVLALEISYGARPRHWWVSPQPVPVVLENRTPVTKTARRRAAEREEKR